MDEKILLINDAIQHRYQITFTYDNYSRTVNPHMIGKLGGELHLHAYQVSNGSTSNPKGWKNFKVENIVNISVLPSTFKPENTYHPDNAHYTSIIKKI